DKQDQIVGYIRNVSPIQEGNFFDFQLQSKDKYMREVCFAHGKRKSQIKRFKVDQRSNTEDLLMSSNF
ncbi:unnamed protein product, partial [Porites lobata]